jgi:hypothetical protein
MITAQTVARIVVRRRFTRDPSITRFPVKMISVITGTGRVRLRTSRLITSVRVGSIPRAIAISVGVPIVFAAGGEAGNRGTVSIKVRRERPQGWKRTVTIFFQGKAEAFCSPPVAINVLQSAPPYRTRRVLSLLFQQEVRMKKLLVILAFAVAVSLTASFGSGRIELRTNPTYDQQRDQQWKRSQQNQQMQQQQREQQAREQQQREQWQRAQWQRDQQQQKQRHEQQHNYDWWVQHHQHDYDNRR